MSKYAAYNDDELLRLLNTADSEQIFTEIYHRYKVPLLLHACRKLDNLSEAEDVVHDLFIAVWKHRNSIKSSIKAYLYSALRHKIIDHQLKNTTSKNTVDSFSRFAALHSQDGTDYKVRESLYIKNIDGLFNELSESDREIIKLRVNGFGNREIADQLNMNEKTLRNRLWNILNKLRSRLTSINFLHFTGTFY